MKREKLSDEKKKKYDEIHAEMLSELEKLPEPKGDKFSYENDKKRREITDKYLPQLKQLFE